MKSEAIAFTVTVLGCVGIGAWLAVQGHPWFALFAMLIAGCCRTSDHKEEAQ